VKDGCDDKYDAVAIECVLAKLNGNSLNSFPKKTVLKYVSHPLSQMQIEAKDILRKERSKLTDDFKLTMESIMNKRDAEINEIKNKYAAIIESENATYNVKMNEYTAKISEIDRG
jgi:hypothetical protein